MKITITRRLSLRAINFGLASGFILFSLAPIYAQTSSSLFNAPWHGFDTGTFNTGFGPSSFAIGDLDGDGDADILVGDSFFGSTGVSVVKNNGDRTYSRPVYYSLSQGQTVGEVALSDFDFDGDLDAIATIPGDYDLLLKIKVWRNSGNGTLGAPIEFATGQGPRGIVTGDFTGDGKPDVVTANFRASSISLLQHNALNGASAGYLTPISFSTGTDAEKIAAADVNGDGKLDVVVGGKLSSTGVATLTVMTNSGTGDFATKVDYVSAPGVTLGTTVVALVDLDNDGDIDLIGGGASNDSSISYGVVSIRRNTGNGTFGTAEIIRLANFDPSPKELSTGDINGDGFADIVAALPSGRATDGFATITSNGSGSFNMPVRYEAAQQTYDVAVLDVDGDGDRDVLTLAQSSAAITIHENPGSGIFQVLPRYVVASLSDAIEGADIDKDGDIDIVVNCEVNIASNFAVVKILKNNGDGTFPPAIDYDPTRNYGDMKLRDINGDGFVDMIFAPDSMSPYHFSTALNLGNGSFGPTVVGELFSCGSGTIDAADLDGDGDLDIVVTEELGCQSSGGPRIFIRRNDGNQTFVSMPTINVSTFPHGLVLADVTNDGKVDIITSLGFGLGVLPGNGNLTFGVPIVSTFRPYTFKMADFNRDGKLDVAMVLVSDSYTETIATALGNGNGTFQPIKTQTGSSVLENLGNSGDIEVADVNRDGTPDIVTFNYASNDVSLFLVNADSSLPHHQRYGIGHTPQFGTLGDFDGDGRIDIAAAIGLPPSGLEDAVVILQNIAPVTRKVPIADFDGDGKTDISVYRPSSGFWYISNSSNYAFRADAFGAAGDLIVPADFDGDGKTDVAVWRPSTGYWYSLDSSNGAFRTSLFGQNGDIPAPADFDGDGKSDTCVFRPSNGTFYIRHSTDGSFQSKQWGQAGDVPVVSDRDGDGKADFSVYRDAIGTFYYLRSIDGGYREQQWGASGDKPISGDFDADGKTDIAVYRPSTGTWYALRSSDSLFIGTAWGTSGDIPAAGDYDGDGKLDVAVFRPSTGIFHILQSTDSSSRAEQFGTNGDEPVPSAYVQ